MPPRTATPRAIIGALAAVLALLALASVAPAAGAATITGVAFEDADRDGARQLTEAPMPDHELYLFDAGGYVAGATTDAYGRYAFSGLDDGEYRLVYEATTWWSLRRDWVPTTTGSLHPERAVHVTGTTSADIGWRRIVRSSDPEAPISRFTGPSGLRVSSYNDAVTAREVHDALASGELGDEAPSVEVRFDLNQSTSMTLTSVTESGGAYSGYSARCYVGYLSWLDVGHRTLSHEYGHAWSLYYAHMVHADPDLTAYVAARGLTGDPRLGSTYAWSTREMIAEDYRQLLGPPSSRGGGQINTEIAPAADVPGLTAFLTDTFAAPAAPAPPPPPPAPPLELRSVAMSPSPVKSTAAALFELSAPADVTVRVLGSNGAVIRSLLVSAGRAAGASTVAWDRRDDAGRRVGRGSYRLQVDAKDGGGRAATASSPFTVA